MLTRPHCAQVGPELTATDLFCFDLAARELSVFAPGVRGYSLSADGKQVLLAGAMISEA